MYFPDTQSLIITYAGCDGWGEGVCFIGGGGGEKACCWCCCIAGDAAGAGLNAAGAGLNDWTGEGEYWTGVGLKCCTGGWGLRLCCGAGGGGATLCGAGAAGSGKVLKSWLLVGPEADVGLWYDCCVLIGLFSRYMSGTVEISPRMAFKSSPWRMGDLSKT